jgi:hypothetical protein
MVLLIDPHYIWFFLIGIFLIYIYSSYVQSIPRSNTKVETFVSLEPRLDPHLDIRDRYNLRTSLREKDRNSPDEIRHMDEITDGVTSENRDETPDETLSSSSNEPEQITQMSILKQNPLRNVVPADTPNETVLPNPFIPKQYFYIEDKLPGDPIGFTIIEEQFNYMIPTIERPPKHTLCFF